MKNNMLWSVKKKDSLWDWLHYIENLSYIPINLSLDRVRKIAIQLDLIHPGKCIVLVGGTNGKGTTCCLLETILLYNNIRVGLYTSPHLLSYKERVRICGKELPDDVHIRAMSVIEDVRTCVELTYFEFSTLSALYMFKQENLDVIILEVGLGGRLDATNIVDADISVITNIAIDHTEFLGTDRNMIAQEKSGIFRFNKPAIVGDINRPMVIDRIAKCQGSILFARGRDWNYFICSDTWSWKCYKDNRLLAFLPIPIIPIENAAVALSILQYLPFSISRKSIDLGLKQAMLPGRFQIVQRKPFVILDVGHNAHAASYLVKKLSVIISITKSVRMIMGMLKNKDIYSTIICLNSVVDMWYFSYLDTPNTADPQQLSDCLLQQKNAIVNIKQFSNILDAWNQVILDASIDDCIVVFGSFYAVNPILNKIIDEKTLM